jgi:hypothetical protein
VPRNPHQLMLVMKVYAVEIAATILFFVLLFKLVRHELGF